MARVLRNGQEYGEPYEYALPFVVRERYDEPLDNGKRGLVEFVGAIGVMTPSQYRAMWKAITGEGWGVLSTRFKAGKKITVELGKSHWN
jgi:hypothetical protein